MSQTDIETRLDRLERQVKQYRLTSVVLGVSLIGLAGLAAVSPSDSQEIRTHKLVILNGQGKEAINLQNGPRGGVLDILNNTGFAVLRAGASEAGAKVALADAQGKEYVELSSAEPGGQVMIANKAGQKQLMKATAGRAEK
jgi:hypothetical protein